MNKQTTTSDPAEGSRETIDHELARTKSDTSIKNPQAEAENPGGQPTDAVKGSASSHPREPQGQQGTTTPKGP